MTGETLELISPVDGSIHAVRPAESARELTAMIGRASAAQRHWRQVPVENRAAIVERAFAELERKADEAAVELAWQIGRPVGEGAGEIQRAADRARYMAGIARTSIDEIEVAPGRAISWEPVGIVLIVAPWNYPYLTATNALAPALASGNAVILKHSFQTALVAERIAAAFASAGLPPDVLQILHCTNPTTLDAVSRPEFGRVVFTGSVEVGRIIAAAAAPNFTPVTLELGGKDAAYVCDDADLQSAIENLADGAFYNSGQSCCGVERIYVDRSCYQAFVEGLAEQAGRLRLGDPLDPRTSLGPMARSEGAAFIRRQIEEAVERGARRMLGAGSGDGHYVPPEILVDVDHRMSVMRDESFGPVVGVVPVESEDEAVRLINDTRFGLTASIWTSDSGRARRVGDQLDVGTVYQNRCDYLDPALPWSGRRDSGSGLSLSKFAFASFNRPKSRLWPAPDALVSQTACLAAQH